MDQWRYQEVRVSENTNQKIQTRKYKPENTNQKIQTRKYKPENTNQEIQTTGNTNNRKYK